MMVNDCVAAHLSSCLPGTTCVFVLPSAELEKPKSGVVVSLSMCFPIVASSCFESQLSTSLRQRVLVGANGSLSGECIFVL